MELLDYAIERELNLTFLKIVNTGNQINIEEIIILMNLLESNYHLSKTDWLIRKLGIIDRSLESQTRIKRDQNHSIFNTVGK